MDEKKNNSCFERCFDDDIKVNLKKKLYDAYEKRSHAFQNTLSDADFRVGLFPDHSGLDEKLIVFIETCKVKSASKLLMWFTAIEGDCDGIPFFKKAVSLLRKYKNEFAVKDEDEDESKDVKSEEEIRKSSEIKFELLSNDSYKKLEKKIRNSRGFLSEIFIKREHLFKKLGGKLEELGIVIVESPQLSGKSSLIESFAEDAEMKGQYTVIDTLPAEVFYLLKRKIEHNKSVDIIELYVTWGRNILTAIFEKNNITRLNQNGHIRDLLEQDAVFKEDLILKRTKWHLSTDIEAMLRVIDDVLIHIEPETPVADDVRKVLEPPVVISVHLDNFHSYSTDKLIEGFNKDLKRLNGKRDKHNSVLKKIRLIVTTRHLHLAISKKPFTITLTNLNKEDIVSICEKILPEFKNDQSRSLFAEYILDFTGGYPWFVNRFVRLYLKKRSEGSESSPLELADSIFRMGQYWLYDEKFEDDYVINEFISGLEKILETHEDKSENFYSFLNETNGFDEQHYKVNPILMQSGFMKLSQDPNRRIKGFGNKIIKMHYTEKIIRELIEENY